MTREIRKSLPHREKCVDRPVCIDAHWCRSWYSYCASFSWVYLMWQWTRSASIENEEKEDAGYRLRLREQSQILTFQRPCSWRRKGWVLWLRSPQRMLSKNSKHHDAPVAFNYYPNLPCYLLWFDCKINEHVNQAHQVDESMRAEDVEIYYDPAELIGGLLISPSQSEPEDNTVSTATATHGCPFSK